MQHRLSECCVCVCVYSRAYLYVNMRVYLLVKGLVCGLSGSQELLTVKNSVFVVKKVLDASG